MYACFRSGSIPKLPAGVKRVSSWKSFGPSTRAVIVGFCELLLTETPAEDSRHADLLEINRAARELMAIFKREPHR